MGGKWEIVGQSGARCRLQHNGAVGGFFGTYDHQLDEKGRVSLPKAFRLGESDDPFVLLQWKPPSLTLFPPETWEKVQERLIEYRSSGDDAWLEVMHLAGMARPTRPDKLGRILIPQQIQEQASLDGTVRMVGNIDRIELWAPEAHDAATRAPSQSFRQFANKIFG